MYDIIRRLKPGRRSNTSEPILNLAKRPLSLVAARNLAALEARPCIAPDWTPRCVKVQNRNYSELRRTEAYFGNVQVRVSGAPPVEMLNMNDDMVSYVYFYYGLDAYESLSVYLFGQLAQEAEAVLDIGAFTGLFGLVAAKCAPAAKVVSFEPVDYIADRARTNGRMNGLRNYSVETVAVSATEGRRTLELYGHTAATSGSSFAKKKVSSLGSAEVDVTTIDAYMARQAPNARLSLIKLDTEGDEVQAIQGGANRITADGPVMLSEVLSNEALEAQIAVMRPYGYDVAFVDEDARALIHLTGPNAVDFDLKRHMYGNVVFFRGDESAARLTDAAETFRNLI